ncbi:AAA-like domain-containing protein [candidate division KSB1 bacterium]|nr:AAA-like domain-containing protein [candidate division KSB1 bacterium]
MREFNTSGPNNPDIHFTVMREALLQKALEQITRPADPKGGRYFTLYAPRQTGKTTFVEQLMKRLGRRQYFPAMISFEALSGLEESTFYRELGKRLDRMGNFPFAIPEMNSRHDFEDFLSALKTQIPQKLCLIIDEFDGLNAPYLGDLLHLLRLIYHARGQKYNLHALILIGVRNLTEINIERASPFNTNDEIRLRFFTREETYDLMAQYEAESGQLFCAGGEGTHFLRNARPAGLGQRAVQKNG